MLCLHDYRNFILDFDGTVVDSERIKFRSFKETIKKLTELPDYTVDLFMDQNFGLDRFSILKQLNKNYGLTIDEQQFVLLYQDSFHNKMSCLPEKLIPGLIKFLKIFSKNTEIYIGSKNNFFYLISFIKQFCPEILQFISGIYASSDKNFLFLFLKSHSHIMDSCISIGDRSTDEKISHDLGLDFIYMNPWHCDIDRTAVRFNSYEELLDSV